MPSGASTGASEACELRDGDASRYDGRGVARAVANVREVLGPALTGIDPADQAAVDGALLALDASPRKTALGGNCLVGGIAGRGPLRRGRARRAPVSTPARHLPRRSIRRLRRRPCPR